MFAEKQERIEKYVNDKDINIRISWAVNCAVEVVKDLDVKERTLYQNDIEMWADYFLNLFDKKRKERTKDDDLCPR